jgi:hypothetical protein
MAYNFSPKIITDGLVLYLDAANTRSYPGSGTVWTDLSRVGNNGTLTNGPTFNSANGGSIVFDGSNDNISTNYNSQLTNFTVCVWFKTSDSSNPGAARIIDKNYISGFWIGKNSTGASNSWGGGVLESSPPYGRYITLTDGQWHFLVSTRLGTTHTIYGDGITNSTSGTVSSTALSTTSLTIAGGAAQVFKGNIAQTSIYNRALSTTEILQNYNATKTRFGL